MRNFWKARRIGRQMDIITAYLLSLFSDIDIKTAVTTNSHRSFVTYEKSTIAIIVCRTNNWHIDVTKPDGFLHITLPAFGGDKFFEIIGNLIMEAILNS